jgi:hypothetical protein
MQLLRSPESQPRRRGNAMATVLAALALIVALCALFLAVFRDPFGPVTKMNWNPMNTGTDTQFAHDALRADPLARYDLSNAGSAYKAEQRMRADVDVRAYIELQKKLEPKEIKEKADTLEIKKEVDIEMPKRGLRPKKDEKSTCKILFTTYKENGEERYEVVLMEKEKESGLWQMRSSDPSYEVQQLGNKAELLKDIREWQAKNKGEERLGAPQ